MSFIPKNAETKQVDKVDERTLLEVIHEYGKRIKSIYIPADFYLLVPSGEIEGVKIKPATGMLENEIAVETV